MCDYSLHGIENRIAVQGENLFVNRFATGCKGFASEADLNQAMKRRSAPTGMNLWARLKFHVAEWWRQRPSERAEACAGLPAVCLPHGSTLHIIESPVAEYLQIVSGAVVGRTVKLVQVTHEPFSFRDAIEYPGGPRVMLQDLPVGVVVEVVSINLAEAKDSTQTAPARAIAALNRR